MGPDTDAATPARTTTGRKRVRPLPLDAVPLEGAPAPGRVARGGRDVHTVARRERYLAVEDYEDPSDREVDDLDPDLLDTDLLDTDLLDIEAGDDMLDGDDGDSGEVSRRRRPMPERIRELTGDERRQVEVYLRELQHAAGLGAWDLTIDWDEESSEECDAQVSVVEGRYTAVVWLHDRFFTLTRTEQRRVLVHELLHMHTTGMLTATRLGLKHLSKDQRSWAMSYVRDAEEHAVDALSQVLAHHLPLPAWGEPATGARYR